jgi:hypothetical protein
MTNGYPALLFTDCTITVYLQFLVETNLNFSISSVFPCNQSSLNPLMMYAAVSPGTKVLDRTMHADN